MTRILIADDHDLVRHGLRDIISTRLEGSVTVGEAKNAREAIRLIGESGWDLVLLDINMPGRNGLEVLPECRRLRPRTPVLILTASAEVEFALRAFKLGATGFLTKESASNELITAIHCILSGGRYVTASLAERLASSLGKFNEGGPREELSRRELQVLRLLAAGKTTSQIAGELDMSEVTAAAYRSRISTKAGLKTNVEIERYAFRHGLVE